MVDAEKLYDLAEEGHAEDIALLRAQLAELRALAKETP